MRILALVLIVVSVVMTSYSLALQAHRNESHYSQQLAGLSMSDDKAFSDLRARSLTQKHPLQDYGITLMFAGAIVFMASRQGRNTLKSPNSRWVFILLAVICPLITVAGAGFDIMQGFNRGDYPPWGDAVMILLLVLPFVFIPLLLWSLFPLCIFWPLRKHHPAPLALALSWRAS